MRKPWLEVATVCLLASACGGLLSPVEGGSDRTDGGGTSSTSSGGASGSYGSNDSGAGRPGAVVPSPGEKPPDPGSVVLPAQLHLVTRYPVPMPSATGIACAGDHVWLVAGGHNAPSHTLSYVALTTSAVDKQLTYSNLIENLGTGVYGITLLDGFVYVSVAGNTNKIVRIDPSTGAIVQAFAAPTQLGPSDLDVSGGNLVESDGTGKVFTLTATTGAVLGSFTAGSSGRNTGVAVRGNQAFVAGLFGGLDVHDLQTGALVGSVTKDDGAALEMGSGVGPMCFNGERLLILSSLGISEYELIAPK
jgi:hypothetical protein